MCSYVVRYEFMGCLKIEEKRYKKRMSIGTFLNDYTKLHFWPIFGSKMGSNCLWFSEM